VLVVGGINADLIIETRRRPGPGETVLGSGYTLGHGGKGANQAVAAAVAGAVVAMVGAVGTDAWGREQLAALSRFGVDVRAVRETPDAPTGLAAISVTPDGENAILVAPGANHAIELTGLFDLLADGDFMRSGVARVVVAQCELEPEVIEETARFARSADARLIINAAPVIELTAQALAAADPLIVNEHEARDVLRLHGGADRGPDVTTSADLAADVLRMTQAKSVVVTLGAEGSMIATHAGVRAIVGEKASVVDTTGAGDMFVGTLAARLADSDDLDAGVRDANAAAARCVTWPGARPPWPGAED
jgi:ribokinase